eukprot:scaffold26126_cov18-Prasinocladus_malaysianus.AAC.1
MNQGEPADTSSSVFVLEKSSPRDLSNWCVDAKSASNGRGIESRPMLLTFIRPVSTLPLISRDLETTLLHDDLMTEVGNVKLMDGSAP